MYAPPLRRLFIPSLICLALILVYRVLPHRQIQHVNLRRLFDTSNHLHPNLAIPFSDLTHHLFSVQRPIRNYLTPTVPKHMHYGSLPSVFRHPSANTTNTTTVAIRLLQPLTQCPIRANKWTGHIRLTTSPIHNISMSPRNTLDEERVFFNPTIIPLTPWSKSQYLVVARVITSGLYQENVICQANLCYVGSANGRESWERPCTPDDLRVLHTPGGMRCVSKPVQISLPPTPAETCQGEFEAYPDIPGSHDPRIFWSGKGEPLLIANSQSRYACFGLWISDLRPVYEPLAAIMMSNDTSLGPQPPLPPVSYRHFTEITRNPANTRGPIEKNFMHFSACPTCPSFVQYEIKPRKRTFAKLVGSGFTSENLTSAEETCIEDEPKDMRDLPSTFYDAKNRGSWHQTSNSIKLVLCRRDDEACIPRPHNTVFLAVIQRKMSNAFALPMRYERYFILWSSSPPYNMLAVSRHPLLFANESASDFPPEENWDGDEEQLAAIGRGERGKDLSVYFTYTVSVSWAWGRWQDNGLDKRRRDGAPKTTTKKKKRRNRLEDMQVGYIDDEAIVGIGLQDKGMGYAVATVQDLLQCMRICPGVQ